MRKTFAIILLITSFISCQQEAFIEEGGVVNAGDVTVDVDPTDEEVFDELDSQDPRPSLDNSNQGLYRGVFATYDGSLHGEIVINVGNDGDYTAAIHFTDGSKHAFIANNRILAGLEFSSTRGSFKFDVSDIDNPVATRVTLDQKLAYVITFKETSSRRLSLVLGHYYDKTDASFKGNWDLISFGIPEFNFPGAQRIESSILSNGGEVFLDTDADQMEAFNGCFGFDVTGAYMAQVSQDIFVVEGKNQSATFNGLRCEWNMSYSFQDNRGTYSNVLCEPGASFGIWTWNGRTGALVIDAIRLN